MKKERFQVCQNPEAFFFRCPCPGIKHPERQKKQFYISMVIKWERGQRNLYLKQPIIESMLIHGGIEA